MRRNRWLCGHCRYEMSVTAGTVFQDSHLPLTIWFRAIWQVTSQKNGISAIGFHPTDEDLSVGAPVCNLFWGWEATRRRG